MITGEQVKAARNLLHWDVAMLADNALVAEAAIVDIENGADVPNEVRVLIRQTLEEAGVEFPDGETVMLESNDKH